ncbi:MAG: hypothetical protein E6Q36_08210 [Chryseobacterium sp.]|nr:MAG: hypothetical protein E6Q36_08210 [Chryseobacterium sp.]
MATPTLGHSGIFLNEFSLSLNGHLDLATMKHLALMDQPEKPEDFGTLDLWAFRRYDQAPFMAAAFRTGNVEIWKTDTYTFELPTAMDSSIRIVRDISGQAKPGENGMPFDILTNRYIGVGARLKFDVMHPLELQVIEGNDEKVGEHFKSRVRVVNTAGRETYVDKNLLVEGSTLVILAHTFNAEFGQEYPTWAIEGSGKKKFINRITNAPIATSYSVTAQAAKYANGAVIDGRAFQLAKDKIREYVALDGISDNGMVSLNDYIGSGGTFTSIGETRIATVLDDIAVEILGREGYNMQLWSSGGDNAADGLDVQQFFPGVYFQFDFAGYKNFYSIPSFSEQVLFGAIKSFTSGKVAPTLTPGSEEVFEIRTGDGGYELITAVFGKYLFTENTWADAFELGLIEGNAKTGLSINQPIVTAYRHPMVGLLRVVKDPSLNGNNNSNPITNPFYGGTGHRLSSYTMLIQPYDVSSSNIKLVRNATAGGGKVDMTVVNGRGATHPLFQQSFGNVTARQGSSLKTGYSVYVETVPDTAIVIDPTEVLKLVPKHPYIVGFGL